MKKCLILLAFFAAVPLAVADTSPLHATPSDPPASAEALVQTKLLLPLQQKEEKRSRFSRAVPPPHARSIRILDSSPKTDAKGSRFVAFAIDETHGSVVKDAITGCVYVDTGEVLVHRGDVYYGASVLWGGQAPMESAGVCRAR